MRKGYTYRWFRREVFKKAMRTLGESKEWRRWFALDRSGLNRHFRRRYGKTLLLPLWAEPKRRVA